jgi:tetratricopeptide (TPR) repeat protein
MLIKRISKSIIATLTALLIFGSVARAQSDTDPFERGTSAYKVGAYELAIREYSQALVSSDNRYLEAIYNIGVCYYELGRKGEAAKWFRSAIKARGGRYPNASYALGIVLEDQGRLGEAKEAFEQAIKWSDERHSSALFKFGLLLYREGDLEGAIASYRKAILRSGGRAPAFHNNLGVALANLGLFSDAEREFSIALKVSDGSFDDARYNLERCRLLLASKSRGMIADLRTSAGEKFSAPR